MSSCGQFQLTSTFYNTIFVLIKTVIDYTVYLYCENKVFSQLLPKGCLNAKLINLCILCICILYNYG